MELDKFIKLLSEKYQIKCTSRESCNWIKEHDACKILQLSTLPIEHFKYFKMINNDQYCLLDDLIQHFKSNYNNANYVVDIFKPMEWQYKNLSSKDTHIIIEIIETVIDKISTEMRGIYTDVGYFINLPIPLLIQTQSYKYIELEGCNTIYIDEWDDLHKNLYMTSIDENLKKWCVAKFIENIITKSDELKDILDNVGKTVANSCCNNSDFPFPLIECLDKFGVKKSSETYKTIMSQFGITDNSSSKESLSEESSDNSEKDLSDSSDNMTDTSSVNFNDVKSLNNNVKKNIYVNKDDYIYDEKKKEYYLSYPTLVNVGATVGTDFSRLYIKKSWELIKYIQNEGRKAYDKLVEEMTMPINERKHMINKLTKDKITYMNKIEELERRMKFYQNCCKDVNLNKKYQEMHNAVK